MSQTATMLVPSTLAMLRRLPPPCPAAPMTAPFRVSLAETGRPNRSLVARNRPAPASEDWRRKSRRFGLKGGLLEEGSSAVLAAYIPPGARGNPVAPGTAGRAGPRRRLFPIKARSQAVACRAAAG